MENRRSSSGPFVRGLPSTDGLDDNGATWLPLLAERLFAANVRREREARGLTQAALARALTVRDVPMSQSAIAKLEREDDATRRPIRLIEAAALAAYFDQSVDDMISTPAGEVDREIHDADRRASAALAEVLAARRELEEAEALYAERQAEVEELRKKAND